MMLFIRYSSCENNIALLGYPLTHTCGLEFLRSTVIQTFLMKICLKKMITISKKHRGQFVKNI